MLLEGAAIRRGLNAAGINIRTRHQQIQLLGKKDLLRVFLSPDGTVGRVAVLAGDQAQGYWTLRNGKHDSFPRVPLRDKTKKGKERNNAPLRPGGSPELLRLLRGTELVQRVQAFDDLCRTTQPELERLLPWPPSHEWIERWRDQLVGAGIDSVKALFDAVLEDLKTSEGLQLLKGIDERVREALGKNPDQRLFELASQVLFLDGGVVLLDMQFPSDSTPACHPANMHALSAALSSGGPDSGKVGACGLIPKVGPLQTGPYPVVKFPEIGERPLFAKFPGDEGDSSPVPNCVFRYRRASSEGMRANADLVKELQGAYEYLVDPVRKGKTWSRISSERVRRDPLSGKKRGLYDLLLTFVPGASDLPLASGIAGESKSLQITEGTFTKLAGDLVRLAKGKDAAHSELARFIVLRKLDLGNSKVMLSTTSGLRELASAAERWTAGCENVPADMIRFPVHFDKAGGSRISGPWVVAPGRIVALGREISTRGGTDGTQAPGPTFADTMQLFMGSRSAQGEAATKLIPIFLTRSGPLLAGVAHARRRGHLRRFHKARRLDEVFDTKKALQAVSVLGLLLYQHVNQRRKEVYMNEAGFMLGQLLAGADVLHRGYCEHQRSGSIPASLLGNQFLPLAQRQPKAAVAQMLPRWKVYHGWAEKNRGYRVDEKLRRSRELKTNEEREESDHQWAIQNAVRLAGRLRHLAGKLHDSLPERADDSFRAELLLGYLAGPPRNGAPAAAPASDSNQTEELED